MEDSVGTTLVSELLSSRDLFLDSEILLCVPCFLSNYPTLRSSRPFRSPFFSFLQANAGILALLESVDLPVLVKTIGASAASACFRMTLTPIDALKVRTFFRVVSSTIRRRVVLTRRYSRSSRLPNKLKEE